MYLRFHHFIGLHEQFSSELELVIVVNINELCSVFELSLRR